MDKLDEKTYKSEKKKRRGVAHNNYVDPSLFIPVQNDDGDSKNDNMITYIY
jgi:hypothetical protein